MDKKQIVESSAFKNQKSNYQLWSDFCAGGDKVEGNEDYLPQHPYESKTQYNIRKSLATYKNHAQPIVSVFSSAVWRKEPNREKLPEALKDYLKNIDNSGTSADMFFRSVDQKAAEHGIRFIVVDSNKAPEGVKIETKKDSKKHNIRPYCISIPALSVVDWGFDENGLSYLVIAEEQTASVDAFSEPVKKKNYKIWFRDKWEVWKETEKEGLVFDNTGVHPCEEVPVVPCYFRKKEEMVGESCISEVISLLKRAYNMENALDKSLFDTAFPQQGFFGFSKDDIDNYIKASSNGLVTSNADADSKFIEPEGRAFEALEKKVKNDELSIKEIALRMIRTDSKVGESAEAKKIDNQQLTSQLSVFSQDCQDAENRCWGLMQKWLNSSTEDIEIKYHDDFDIETITGDLIRAFAEMRRNKDISRETFWKILRKAEVPFPDDFDEEEEAEALENEIRSSGTMGEIGSKFLSETGKN